MMVPMTSGRNVTASSSVSTAPAIRSPEISSDMVGRSSSDEVPCSMPSRTRGLGGSPRERRTQRRTVSAQKMAMRPKLMSAEGAPVLVVQVGESVARAPQLTLGSHVALLHYDDGAAGVGRCLCRDRHHARRLARKRSDAPCSRRWQYHAEV